MGSQFDLFLVYCDGGGGLEKVFWTSFQKRYLLIFDLFFFYCDGRDLKRDIERDIERDIDRDIERDIDEVKKVLLFC